MNPQVGIIMGSQSDLPVMAEAAQFLEDMGIAFELTVVSAHRTPKRMIDYAESARERGIKVIVAGAGGAAHLPGMVASLTSLPVIGVPVHSSNSIDGWDSILSILQMPSGIPVATVALNGGKNAGILAASILGAYDTAVGQKMDVFKKGLREKVEESAAQLEEKGWKDSLKK
jgi:5-(carboxyamino)imidazole ribonucleotide mutase